MEWVRLVPSLVVTSSIFVPSLVVTSSLPHTKEVFGFGAHWIHLLFGRGPHLTYLDLYIEIVHVCVHVTML